MKNNGKVRDIRSMASKIKVLNGEASNGLFCIVLCSQGNGENRILPKQKSNFA